MINELKTASTMDDFHALATVAADMVVIGYMALAGIPFTKEAREDFIDFLDENGIVFYVSVLRHDKEYFIGAGNGFGAKSAGEMIQHLQETGALHTKNCEYTGVTRT